MLQGHKLIELGVRDVARFWFSVLIILAFAAITVPGRAQETTDGVGDPFTLKQPVTLSTIDVVSFKGAIDINEQFLEIGTRAGFAYALASTGEGPAKVLHTLSSVPFGIENRLIRTFTFSGAILEEGADRFQTVESFALQSCDPAGTGGVSLGVDFFSELERGRASSFSMAETASTRFEGMYGGFGTGSTAVTVSLASGSASESAIGSQSYTSTVTLDGTYDFNYSINVNGGK